MARTQKITLIWRITNQEIFAPKGVEFERKDKWLRDLQFTTPPNEQRFVKEEFSIYDPEVLDSRRFFEGVAMVYYTIQNKEIFDGLPEAKLVKDQRDSLLQEILGYDRKLGNLLKKERASTTEFSEVQQWVVFLNTVKEEFFDPNGYEFPDSDEFWKLAKKVGSYDEAKAISIKKLQDSLRRKYESK